MLPDIEDEATGRIGPGGTEIHVLDENWEALNVYLTCQHPMAVGMGGASQLPLAAQEVRAALELSGMSRKRWPAQAELIFDFGRHCAKARNDRNATAGKAR